MDFTQQQQQLRRCKRAATSSVQSGRALLALAACLSSPACAFSGLRTPVTAEFRSRSFPTTFYGASPASADHPARKRSTTEAFRKSRTESRLYYRDESSMGDANVSDASVSSNSNRWWSSFLSPAAAKEPVDDTTEKVDEYLEFLEKRYNHLHEDEFQQKNQAKKKKGFSALNWLYGDDSDAESSARPMEEDALYALGVAGLASERLLQKHQLDPAMVKSANGAETVSSSPRESNVIDATISATSVELPSNKVAAVFSVMALRLAPLFARVAEQRRQLLRFQSRKVREALQAVGRFPKVLPEIWKMGGGAVTVTATFAVVASLSFFVLRPLAQTILSATSQA